jgi:hypothetical protein
MILEFYIIGGYLKISKKIFIKEMLSRESRLRSLLNWKSEGDFKNSHPEVNEPDMNDFITIRFGSESTVSIGESPEEILKELKARYREKIKGFIGGRGEYKTLNMSFFFQIDLNSDDDKIIYLSH